MPDGGARSAYMVAVSDESAADPVNNTTYVDARTGDILVREDNVDEENDDPTWKAFPENPPADYSSTDTRELWCWTATAGCDRVMSNPSSPLPWDIDPSVSSTDSTHTTRGNNEYAAQAWLNARGVGFNMTGFATPSPTRDYTYAWTNQWHDTSCSPGAFDSPQHNDIDAADTNLHAMHNRMHDFAYKLGFTESAWNMQVDNFGKGGLGNDPEQGNSQSALAGVLAEPRDRREQRLGVRVVHAGEQVVGLGGLDDPARVHDVDPVRVSRDHAHVVRDQQHRHAEPRLQVVEQLEYLGLNRHVERGRGLVGDQQLGLAGQRHRDHDALPEAARELVRVVAEPFPGLRQPDQAEHLGGSLDRLGLGARSCAA